MPSGNNGPFSESWILLLFLCSVLIAVAFILMVFLKLALCRHFRRNKIVPPPTPPLRRNVSISTIYPPSPHAVKLPKRLQREDTDNVSIGEGEPLSYLSIKQAFCQPQEEKLSDLVLSEFQGQSLDMGRNSCGFLLIRIPKFAGDLPSVHRNPSPPPPYSPSVMRTENFQDTFLRLT